MFIHAQNYLLEFNFNFNENWIINNNAYKIHVLFLIGFIVYVTIILIDFSFILVYEISKEKNVLKTCLWLPLSQRLIYKEFMHFLRWIISCQKAFYLFLFIIFIHLWICLDWIFFEYSCCKIHLIFYCGK